MDAPTPFLSVITAHPSSEQVEVLRESLEWHPGLQDAEIVCTVGAGSIAQAYNQGAKAARGQIFLFTHSDVEIVSSRKILAQAIAQAKEPKAGFVGIAGARVLKEEAIWWKQGDQLSGACMHTDGEQLWMTAFGSYGQVVVLDGVFLMCKRDLFEELGGFDESIPGWDFYDIDITLRAYLKGYINLTYPLHVLHHSLGDVTGKTGWHKNREAFAEKHKGILPIVAERRSLEPEPPPSGQAPQEAQPPTPSA